MMNCASSVCLLNKWIKRRVWLTAIRLFLIAHRRKPDAHSHPVFNNAEKNLFWRNQALLIFDIPRRRTRIFRRCRPASMSNFLSLLLACFLFVSAHHLLAATFILQPTHHHLQ